MLIVAFQGDGLRQIADGYVVGDSPGVSRFAAEFAANIGQCGDDTGDADGYCQYSQAQNEHLQLVDLMGDFTALCFRDFLQGFDIVEQGLLECAPGGGFLFVDQGFCFVLLISLESNQNGTLCFGLCLGQWFETCYRVGKAFYICRSGGGGFTGIGKVLAGFFQVLIGLGVGRIKRNVAQRLAHL